MKSNNRKFILFVLMAVIAVPTLSNIVPQVFAVPSADTVWINGQPVLTLTEADQEGVLIPVGFIQVDPNANIPPTLIALTEKENGPISDILMYDPTGTFCHPSQNGPPVNLCFISDDDKQSLDNQLSSWLESGLFIPYTIPESGMQQDVSSLLGGAPVSVQSDVEPNPTIPEFPIPFSMVIIFVAVAAVYLGIRQKMPGFKSF